MVHKGVIRLQRGGFSRDADVVYRNRYTAPSDLDSGRRKMC